MESTHGGSHRAGREETPDVLPASQFLQERLQERRSRNTRPKRVRQSDFGPRRGRDDDIFLTEADESRHGSARMFDSSPLAAGSSNGSEAGKSNGRKKTFGARDMDDHLDRLTKQNFALKLELDHRREQTVKLKEEIEDMRMQVERAQQLQDEHAELLRINSQLVEELEKRDQAVEEAIDVICDLEEQVTDLTERRSVTRPSTANADSGYAGTETHEHMPPSSPPEPAKASKIPNSRQRQPPPAASAATGRLLDVVNAQTPARPKREPAVLTQKKQSTNALRSVYLETAHSLNPVKSFNSLLTRQESRAEDEVTLDSPRLSVLSESSFPSIYSPKKHISPDRFTWEAEDEVAPDSQSSSRSHLRQDSIKRVSQWMDERDQPEPTPSKSNRITSPLSQQMESGRSPSPSQRPGDGAKFQSLADTLSAASRSARNPADSLSPNVSYIRPYPIRTKEQPRPTSFGGPIFGEPLLPPTPDSASTRMLRASRSSLGEERSILDITPAAIKGYDALEPGSRTAPKQMRSSVELNTAYESYIQRRNDASEIENAIALDDDADSPSGTVRDLSLEYEGFPDGDSIIMGTPSRFLKHGKPSLQLYDGYEGPPSIVRSPIKRRQSSSEATVSARKPSLGRAETSPTILGSLGRIVTGGTQSSGGTVTSPRSQHSGSSSNKTILLPEPGTTRGISPDSSNSESRPQVNLASPPRGSRASPSPARTLSQKTQRLFRRMSNSHSQSDREKSPLPTLTSTPSSVYVNDVPKEVRRPGTSHAGTSTGASMQRSLSSRDGRRPSVQPRTSTTPYQPPPTRPLSASQTDKKSQTEGRQRVTPFTRRNSAQKGVATPPPSMPAVFVPPESSDGKNVPPKRRNSIKDAVASAARRPWR